MTYLLLGCAIALSAAAAYYSIVGLIAIFAGAAIPIAVMGGILEVSKLVVTSWLYRNWKQTPRLLKGYFISAIAVLMILTSMGIFGFLSKAHIDQNLISGDVVAKLSLIEEKLKIEKENIDAARKVITQLDQQVDQTLGRSTTESGAISSANLRRSQAKEREKAQKEILSAQGKIAKLNEEKAPISAEVRKVEAEVGPIKYIAALIYGDSPDANLLEKAVRVVILMIVFVFDPLAVLMFIAVNQTMLQRKPYPIVHKEGQNVNNEIQNEPVPEPKVEPEEEPPLEEGNKYHIKISENVIQSDQANMEKVDTNTGIGKVAL